MTKNIMIVGVGGQGSLLASKLLGRLLVDEGYTSFGITGEIALSIMPDVFYDLDAPIMRVCSPDVPVPFSPALEKLIIPDENRIREAIRKML